MMAKRFTKALGVRSAKTASLAVAAVVGLCATTGQSAPPGGQRVTALEITRGTFLNLDVSPDGRTIVFDLLGDLYLLPMTGGAATPLLTGRDWDQAPRFSPDGKTVAFVSDRDGMENVWIVPLAGGQPEQLTNLKEPVAGTPSWSPDGREVLFGMRSVSSRLQLVSRDSREIRPLEKQRAGALADELYTYNYVAATSGVTATSGMTYFSEIHVVHPRSGFRHGSRSLLVAVNTRDGSRRVLTDLIQPYNESKPQLSLSGRLLAYYRANGDGATELRVRDLQDNTDRYLTDVPNTDDPYRWGDRGDPMPTFAFDKGEEAIVVAFGGRIYRVSISDGHRSEIPFHLSAALDIAPRAVPRHRLADGLLDVKAIRWPSFSRDRRRAAFSALGSIWIQDLPSADPRRLTTGAAFEHMPAISPDGQRVVYVSYGDRSTRGQMMLARVDGAEPRSIADGDFAYFAPAWSHDGTKIGFVREGHPSGRLHDPRGVVMEYGWLDLQRKTVTIVASVPRAPVYQSPLALHVSFSDDDRELLGTATPELLRTVVFAVSLDGSVRRELATAGRDVLGAVPSGDGRFIAFIGWNEDLWLAAVTPNGRAQELHPDPMLATLVTDDATTYFSWSASNELLVASGGRVTHVDGADPTRRASTTLRLTAPRHEGTGTLALVNARVLTVAGAHGVGPVLDRGTVIIRGRRIAAVGPAGEVTLPPDATVMDASGLTVLPGFHDAHYHTIGQDAGFSPREDRTALAFGLTSAWDALTGYGDMSLAAEEMRAVGRLAGPRWFFAGRSVEHFGGQVRGPNDARSSTRRHAAIGVELLKDYNVLERPVRRWFADAARAEGLGITAHSEGLGEMLSRVADGYTALEHTQFYASLEDDVLALLAQTGTILTPHALLADGSSSVDNEPLRVYFEELQRRKPAQVAKVRQYVDAGTFSKWTTPTEKPLEQIRAFRVAQMCAAIVRGGGRIAVSGHNAPAILAHVEMWLLSKGGVPPDEVIRAATRTGIEKIGYFDDLGSIEAGKIADLVVLSSDPLADVLNTVDVRYTVVDGIAYDASTNGEIPLSPRR